MLNKTVHAPTHHHIGTSECRHMSDYRGAATPYAFWLGSSTVIVLSGSNIMLHYYASSFFCYNDYPSIWLSVCLKTTLISRVIVKWRSEHQVKPMLSVVLTPKGLELCILSLQRAAIL